MQIHLYEKHILQIHIARPAFVKISRLLTNQNPIFLCKVQLTLKDTIFHHLKIKFDNSLKRITIKPCGGLLGCQIEMK
jgi:hypothetical protein